MGDLVAISTQKNSIPIAYVWPENDLGLAEEELHEPLVDLRGFFSGDREATQHAAMLIRSSCLNYGFFQAINHGVDPMLIAMAHRQAKAFFKLPMSEKQKGRPQPDSKCGFSASHAERFSGKLPWKETLSFDFHESGTNDAVSKFFESFFGEGFEEAGLVFERYCDALKKFSLSVMELLGISLGIDQSILREFYEDGTAIMRANYYPTCPEPGLTLGTGPHRDPTSITILHQEEAGSVGLHVLVDNKWKFVRPRNDAFVINIGDTFMALTNGIYKSCMHRAVVNKDIERISLTYFLNPRADRVVKPPEGLIRRSRGREDNEEPRKYPDFTWFHFLRYTQKHYRADGATLQNFTKWLISSNSYK